MANQTDLDKVWFIVSPHNPLKKKTSLANDYDRLHLVRTAIDDNYKLWASDIEFGLPQPSYTIDTLMALEEKYPDKTFVLIMGGDNIQTIDKWKNFEKILSYPIYVYARPDYDISGKQLPESVKIFNDVPLLNISSTYIRECIAHKKDYRYLVTDDVYEAIRNSNLYR